MTLTTSGLGGVQQNSFLHLRPESLKNICKRVQFLLKLLGEGDCNCNEVVFGNKYIIGNTYNFLQIGVDEEEDIEYEDETEEEEK